jgi:hypothetical protein
MKWVLNVFDAFDAAVLLESFWPAAADNPNVRVLVCMKMISGNTRERIFMGSLCIVTKT